MFSSVISKLKSNVMKKVSFLVFTLLIATLITHAQTIYVANSNPGAASGVNVFTGAAALQEAVTAAAEGDIVYIIPSVVIYGDITIVKGITLFGVGIRPDKDVGLKSETSVILIEASNVRISGLISSTIWIGIGSNNVTLSNITIENSRVSAVMHTSDLTVPVANVLIRNNIIDGSFTPFEFYLSSNISIANNVIYTSAPAQTKIRGNKINFYNNLFTYSVGGISFADIDNCIFKHNIFYGTTVDLFSASTGNVWDDNLSFGATNNIFSVGLYSNTSNSPNLENVDPMFVNMPINSTWSDAHDFTLTAGSPAINVNGTDIGPSGGATPFDYEGNMLPLIQQVSIPAVISVGSDLPVTIKAKGN
jgi:hypothetical protein